MWFPDKGQWLIIWIGFLLASFAVVSASVGGAVFLTVIALLLIWYREGRRRNKKASMENLATENAATENHAEDPIEDDGTFMIASHSTPNPKALQRKDSGDQKPPRWTTDVIPWTLEELRKARLTDEIPERFRKEEKL
jgi:hypothetical protein